MKIDKSVKGPGPIAPDGMEPLPEVATDVSIATGNNRLGTVSEMKAKRLLDRVQRGEKFNEAIKAERMRVGDLQDHDNPVRASVEQLIGHYFLPPEARKQMVRAGLNRLFLENIQSVDTNAQKIALDAAKQIGSDPEVGLQAEVTGGVVINIGELDAVFNQLRKAEVPEINDGRQRNDREDEREIITIAEGYGDKPAPLPALPEGPTNKPGEE